MIHNIVILWYEIAWCIRVELLWLREYFIIGPRDPPRLRYYIAYNIKEVLCFSKFSRLFVGFFPNWQILFVLFYFGSEITPTRPSRAVWPRLTRARLLGSGQSCSNVTQKRHVFAQPMLRRGNVLIKTNLAKRTKITRKYFIILYIIFLRNGAHPYKSRCSSCYYTFRLKGVGGQ